jgi:hypothetical protein
MGLFFGGFCVFQVFFKGFSWVVFDFFSVQTTVPIFFIPAQSVAFDPNLNVFSQYVAFEPNIWFLKTIQLGCKISMSLFNLV